MLQFIRILLTNAWRGTRRANVIPAIVLMLASIGVLLVGSSAAASTDGHGPLHAASQAISHVRQLAFGSTGTDNKNVPISKTHEKSVADGTDKASTSKPSIDESSDGVNPTTSQQNQGTASSSASVQLTTGQPACDQAQIAYTVASALFTLHSPTTADGTLSYSWETRIDSGTNSSGQPPISATQTSQDLPAGSSQVTLPDSQAQPLLSAPTNTNYAYSFRLHVLVGSTDTISSWVSIPQATSTACSSN